MTPQERIAALEHEGFTHRQAGFLVMVMLHSGVCMLRQYCAYAHLVHGQKTRDFFSTLVARRFATAYSAAHRRARIFHIHGKRLYAVISEPNNRNRKPITLARAIERLMILDAVIAEPQMRWLGSEKEKVAYFLQSTSLRLGELPSISFGQAPKLTVRQFPDKSPIGVTDDGRTHVFLYLITREAPVDFRAFLHRHAELLRALPEWELRLLVPAHLHASSRAFEAAARQEMATPLRMDSREELTWYFGQRQKVDVGGVGDDPDRFRRAARQFHAPRFRALYRAWRKDGDAILHATVSRTLGDALTRRTGRVGSHVLPRSYQHLSPLVGSA